MTSLSNTWAHYVDILKCGGVVACPTETLIGLLADATNPEAIDKVVHIKQRLENKPIAVLAPNIAAVEQLATLPEGRARALAETYWPGPLTLLLPAHKHVHTALQKDGRIGVRIPGKSLAFDLSQAFGGPLTATSANLSGTPAVTDTADLSTEITTQVHAIVPGASPGGPPSTIVDATHNSLHILREGAVKIQM